MVGVLRPTPRRECGVDLRVSFRSNRESWPGGGQAIAGHGGGLAARPWVAGPDDQGKLSA